MPAPNSTLWDVLDTTLNHSSAQAVCVARGGNLITVDSGEKARLFVGSVSPLLRQLQRYEAWIGLWSGDYNFHTNNRAAYRWFSGSNSTYQKWADATQWGYGLQPDNMGNVQGVCVAAGASVGVPFDTAGSWDDQECHHEKIFVCERANRTVCSAATSELVNNTCVPTCPAGTSRKSSGACGEHSWQGSSVP